MKPQEDTNGKKRLTHIAKNMIFILSKHKTLHSIILTEESITGKGKNTWINEVGQDLLDDNIPMLSKKPESTEVEIRNIAPNPRFAFVHVKEKNGCIK
jgi:hypothetical protein